MSGVIRLGEEEDFEKRLRAEWGDSLAEHLKAAGLTRRDLIRALADLGLPVSEQAVSQWISGNSAPRPRFQAAIGAVLKVPVHRVFPIGNAA